MCQIVVAGTASEAQDEWFVRQRVYEVECRIMSQRLAGMGLTSEPIMVIERHFGHRMRTGIAGRSHQDGSGYGCCLEVRFYDAV